MPRWPRAGLLGNTLLLVSIACAVGLGPRLLEGQAALEWTRYHALRGPNALRGAEQAQRAGRAAARAIHELAPLPQAAEAARLGLELARGLEPASRPAALALAAELRPALERVGASRWRGFALGELARQAREREQALKAPAAAGS